MGSGNPEQELTCVQRQRLGGASIHGKSRSCVAIAYEVSGSADWNGALTIDRWMIKSSQAWNQHVS